MHIHKKPYIPCSITLTYSKISFPHYLTSKIYLAERFSVRQETKQSEYVNLHILKQKLSRRQVHIVYPLY
jgi:hypothetical protein